LGYGRWTRANAELCLIATKGKPKRIDAGVHSVIDTLFKHTVKNQMKQGSEIIKLVGDLPRIELFAREKTPGWTSIGHDISGKDIREELRDL